MSSLLSLPEDLLNDIAFWLDDERDVCSLELTSKNFHMNLSNPSRAGRCERRLDLRLWCKYSSSLEAIRWVQKRARRYTHIVSHFRDTLLDHTVEFDHGIANYTVPALLSSLLAACDSSAELTLSVEADQGDRFFALSQHSAGPEPSPFWGVLRQHLTTLTLETNLGQDIARDLGIIAGLTALQCLEIGWDRSPHGRPYGNLSGKTVAFKLPYLMCLQLSALEQGELVLTCPKLAEAYIYHTNSLRIELQDAALSDLALIDCQQVQFAMCSPPDQLKNLTTLVVRACSEVGGRIMNHLCHMGLLQELNYGYFSNELMPSSFPQGLHEITLFPLGWRQDLPAGLKELHQLTRFCFESDYESWVLTRPLAEQLPMRNLRYLQLSLGLHVFSPEEIEANS